jgi:hypothetical protein
MSRLIEILGVLLIASFSQGVTGRTLYVDCSVPQSGDGSSWEKALKTIQQGIDGAIDGDTVIVAAGTYYENLHFRSKNITLQSTNPLDPSVVANTIIDGGWRGPVVTFAGSEDERCVLSGFTIQHGRADEGAGICGGGSLYEQTRATVRKNVVRANVAFGSYASASPGGGGSKGTMPLYPLGNGGGMAFCDGVIEHNVVTENFARLGGGLYRCQGNVRGCTISWNAAVERGGGLCDCGGAVENNLIASNVCHRDGGGLHGCSGTIQGNTVGENFASNNGGGLYDCDGLIQGNLIDANWVTWYGGGLYGCDTTVRQNTIRGNLAYQGGGLAVCSGTIEGNAITGNRAEREYGAEVAGQALGTGIADQRSVLAGFVDGCGGGLYDCDGAIHGNVISENRAGTAGGGLYHCDGVIWNNTICYNGARSQYSRGGGLAYCAGTIESNTIYGNYAPYEGGLSGRQGTIRNCIIWGNNGAQQLSDSSAPTYSCIEGWAGGGEGNIADDPRFVDPDGPDNNLSTYEDNDFRLWPDSPCIDAGLNDLELPETDIAGMHRIMFGGKSLTVDMGAYEFYINDLTPGPNPDQTTFTWSSLADKTYSVFYCSDLLTWTLATASFPSSGDTTTSWTDDGSQTGVAPGVVPRRFYRTLENPQ